LRLHFSQNLPIQNESTEQKLLCQSTPTKLLEIDNSKKEYRNFQVNIFILFFLVKLSLPSHKKKLIFSQGIDFGWQSDVCSIKLSPAKVPQIGELVEPSKGTCYS